MSNRPVPKARWVIYEIATGTEVACLLSRCTCQDCAEAVMVFHGFHPCKYSVKEV